MTMTIRSVWLLLLLLLASVANAPAVPNTQQSQMTLKYVALVNQPGLAETGLIGAVVSRGGGGSSGIASWANTKGTFTQDAAVGGVRNVGY